MHKASNLRERRFCTLGDSESITCPAAQLDGHTLAEKNALKAQL